MFKRIFIIAFGAYLLTLTSGLVFAAPGKKIPHRILQRFAGDTGQFGTAYLLEGGIQFTLKSAEYTAARVNIGSNSYMPDAGQKLLLLHYSILNPLSQGLAMVYDWKTIPFTAVDAVGNTWKTVADAGQEPTGQPAAFVLKPGESYQNLYTVIAVPSLGALPTLFVESGRTGSNAPYIAYDLTGKIRPLAAPFTLSVVPAKKGDYYPMGYFDARLDSVSFTNAVLSGTAPDTGQRYLQAIFTLKNKSASQQSVAWDDFKADLRDANGALVPYNRFMLLPTADDDGSADLEPDAETQVRFFWTLPDTTGAKTILLSEGNSRVYAFGVSDLK